MKELLDFADQHPDQWTFICEIVGGGKPDDCQDNPVGPHPSTGKQLLIGAEIVGGYAAAALPFAGLVSGPAIADEWEFASQEEEAELGSKLEYFFGNATGKAHNIKRSGDMVSQLNRIGIQDNVRGRAMFEKHLRDVYADPNTVVRVQENGRTVRDGLLYGPVYC